MSLPSFKRCGCLFGQLSGMCGQNRRLTPAAVTGRCYSSSVVEDGFCLITTDSPHVWRCARRFLFLQLWYSMVLPAQLGAMEIFRERRRLPVLSLERQFGNTSYSLMSN